jgi:hypothetical protein
MKIIKLDEKRSDDAKTTLEWALDEVDNYDEIMVIGKRKDNDQYDAFPSNIKSAFWWIGALEAFKRSIMDEYLGDPEE